MNQQLRLFQDKRSINTKTCGKLPKMTSMNKKQEIQISHKLLPKGLLQNIEVLNVVLLLRLIDFLSHWIRKSQRLIFSVTIKKLKKEPKANNLSY